MKPLRVLVVDDSAYNRRTIATMLSSLDGVEVVGKASDGDEALRLASTLLPDLITLDLEMPRVDGFTFLRLLMAKRPTPVIVVSGYSQKENVFRALELGALDFVPKPTRTVSSDLSAIQEELAEKVALVRQLAPASVQRARSAGSLRPARFRGREETQRIFVPQAQPATDKLVVIGASTGGPTALLQFFAQMPPTAAVAVAQHMPERFTSTFAQRLDRQGRMRVREAEEVHELMPGAAYVCPGGKCLEVARDAQGALYVQVLPSRPQDRYVPSVDRLFESAAKAAGERVIAVVLTGMGDDGSRGVLAVKEAGGIALAESEETAVIYGMPGAAMRTGRVDMTLPLQELGARVAELVGG